MVYVDMGASPLSLIVKNLGYTNRESNYCLSVVLYSFSILNLMVYDFDSMAISKLPLICVSSNGCCYYLCRDL
jgi:hypothetical protein